METTTHGRRPSILIVEDEAIVALTLRKFLAMADYDVPKVVSRGEEVLSEIEECDPDALVMDILLADQMTGLEAATEVRRVSDIPIVFVTGYPDPSIEEAVRTISGTTLLIKPVPSEKIINAVATALSGATR